MRLSFRASTLTLALSLISICALAQVTGGVRQMEFLRLPNSPHISALGGIAVASQDDDISFALQNPALMRPGLHNQLGLNYNNFYAGISTANLNYGYHVPKINTSFALGIQYLNYGTFKATDPVGHIYGDVRAADYAISLGAARQYKEKWRYGATLKFAHSQLADKSASALLADVGVVRYDTASLWMFGIVAKNMGFSLRNYTKGNQEPLPFDLQLGISKQMRNIPLRLMMNVHHLYEWDIRYDNPADQPTGLIATPDSNAKEKSHFGDKLFRHFNFAAELTFFKRVTASVGYSHLRRSELALTEKKATAGFSFGASVDLNKFKVYYARSYYHIAGAYNEFGLALQLNQLTGIGSLTEKWHWRAEYPNW